ncbi:MAG: hypothetical protein U0324_08785 [Polyangiales bacterium]
MSPRAPSPDSPSPSVSLAGEFEGTERALWWRVLSLPWAALRGVVEAVLRVAFSLQSPCTVALEGDVIRVKGHTEILGRTLREYDHRFPVANLTEVRRETRFPMLPAAASVFALFVGSTLGARSVIEGAGGRYWVLVAIGGGLIAGGVLFDFLLRALFPGVTGRTRLTLRARDKRSVILTGLEVAGLDRLLDALDQRLTAPRAPAATPAPRLEPLLHGAEALGGETVRDGSPSRG